MNALRARVARAETETRDAGQALRSAWQPWRERLREHRVALAAGGGFAAGLMLAAIPGRFWLRTLRLTTGLLRSGVLRARLGALLRTGKP